MYGTSDLFPFVHIRAEVSALVICLAICLDVHLGANWSPWSIRCFRVPEYMIVLVPLRDLGVIPVVWLPSALSSVNTLKVRLPSVIIAVVDWSCGCMYTTLAPSGDVFGCCDQGSHLAPK